MATNGRQGPMSPDQAAAMRMMQEAMQQQQAQEAPQSADGLYQHRKLRKGDNLDFHDEVWDEKSTLAYSQGVKERDWNAKVTTLQKDRDPRTFESNKQRDLSFEMHRFFHADHTPPNFGLTANSSHYDKLMSLLTRAPEREPSNTSYIHEALSNPRWDADKKRLAIRSLMEFNFDPNREWNSEFPIERAVRVGDPQIVTTLLQHGAHAHVYDSRGYNLLSSAIESGNHELIPILAKYKVDAKNTAAGDTPVMLAINKLKHDVKANPKEAYTAFYKTVGYLHTYGYFNSNHKKGDPLIERGTPEYEELAELKKSLGHDHRQMFQVMTEGLNNLEPLGKDEMSSLVISAPKRVPPFTNPGGIQSAPDSFAFSIKGMRDRASRKLALKITDDLLEAAANSNNDADFRAYVKGSKFRNESFFNETIPRLRDILNLDRPQAKYPNDTIIHRAARIGSPAMLDFCMREHCNLHVVNSDGDYPIHLAAQLSDKRAVKEMLAKMVGVVNPATGKRESLYEDGKIADMKALNGNGENFIEVVARVHGEEFAKDIINHLEMGLDRNADLPSNLLLKARPDLPPLNELRLTPVLPLTTNVLGAQYIGIDPNGDIPPVRTESANESPDELKALNRQREEDVYRLVAMLDSPDASSERKQELRTALKNTLSTLSLGTRASIMLNAMDKINENLLDDKELKGAQELNNLRRGVYLRMASDLANNLKDPEQAKKAMLEMEVHTPNGKQNAIKMAGALAAVEGDVDALGLIDQINHYTDTANSNRFSNDPNFKSWYDDVNGGNSPPSPKQP